MGKDPALGWIAVVIKTTCVLEKAEPHNQQKIEDLPDSLPVSVYYYAIILKCFTGDEDPYDKGWPMATSQDNPLAITPRRNSAEREYIALCHGTTGPEVIPYWHYAHGLDKMTCRHSYQPSTSANIS